MYACERQVERKMQAAACLRSLEERSLLDQTWSIAYSAVDI
jgi:hypothetical protein